MGQYEWLEKRVLRSVDQLKLWSENPRLDPEEKHMNLSDYVSDLICETSEKNNFYKLIDSIASEGFIPAEPIVVWKDNGKYVVAEGNRRILALKLLRNPAKSPRSIRAYIRKKSDLIDRDSIEKIRVCVAPSFKDCRWYINQRHSSSSSLQVRWSRLQQQRWIVELYDEFGGDIDKIVKITKQTRSELEYTLRILKIRDLAVDHDVLKYLTHEQIGKVKSHHIHMTVLERWFNDLRVREQWGIEFNGHNVRITSNHKSFKKAYATWLIHVFDKDPNSEIKIDTRTVPQYVDKILEALPKVFFDDIDHADDVIENNEDALDSLENDEVELKIDNGVKKVLNKNPDRNQLIIETLKIDVSSNKLNALFKELKRLPVTRYNNISSVSLRVFLDLSVAEYLTAEGVKDDVSRMYNAAFINVPLKQRLEYLKKNKISAKTPVAKVVDKLLNPSNEHSLDTLNNYIHGTDQQHTNKRFLNGFWDFLSPLLEVLVNLREEK
ncbi:ParB N-terminal domain-containing protein [Amphritea sp.]|uniref:ParB N-terminal domain-containing protein n=1 Tax=Amphritea sp. TaxID=1872502 RepID=UPI003D0D09E3